MAGPSLIVDYVPGRWVLSAVLVNLRTPDPAGNKVGPQSYPDQGGWEDTSHRIFRGIPSAIEFAYLIKLASFLSWDHPTTGTHPYCPTYEIKIHERYVMTMVYNRLPVTRSGVLNLMKQGSKAPLSALTVVQPLQHARLDVC